MTERPRAGTASGTPAGTVRVKTPYPLFEDPERYLALRQPGGLAGALKTRSEWAALASCLRELQGAALVLDVPCGPGRLYRYFLQRGRRVVGGDFDPKMLSSASRVRRTLDLQGVDCRADAFRLPWRDGAFDCAVSVRFAYYFARPERVALLAELARVSRMGIVVQYKINYSLLSRLRRLTGKARKRNRGKFLLARREIVEDFREAGLGVDRVAPISLAGSDRAFVLSKLPG